MKRVEHNLGKQKSNPPELLLLFRNFKSQENEYKTNYILSPTNLVGEI